MEIREIGVEKVTETIRNLCIEANTNLGDDVIQAYKECLENEESSMGRDAIRYLLDNAKKIVAFTGAGISSESGISAFENYRSLMNKVLGG